MSHNFFIAVVWTWSIYLSVFPITFTPTSAQQKSLLLLKLHISSFKKNLLSVPVNNIINANDEICIAKLLHQANILCYTNTIYACSKTVVHLKFPHLAPLQDWECSTFFVKQVTLVTTALQQTYLFLFFIFL